MLSTVQRVSRAEVIIEGKIYSSIGSGLLIFICIEENDTSKIFKRFYSNRPDKFGEHSGLGLNIVKNLVDLHDGEIVASNRLDREGAIVEINFPGV